MSKMISVRLPDRDAETIDRLVADGRYPNRTAFVSGVVHEALEAERAQNIRELYRKAYGEQPLAEDEQWIFDARDRSLRDVR